MVWWESTVAIMGCRDEEMQALEVGAKESARCRRAAMQCEAWQRMPVSRACGAGFGDVGAGTGAQLGTARGVPYCCTVSMVPYLISC